MRNPALTTVVTTSPIVQSREELHDGALLRHAHTLAFQHGQQIDRVTIFEIEGLIDRADGLTEGERPMQTETQRGLIISQSILIGECAAQRC